MKKFILFYLLLSLTFLSSGFAKDIELSEKMYIKEKLLSWTRTFDIENEEGRVGRVYRKFFAWTSQYQLEDLEGELLAKAVGSFFTFGTDFEITDAQENLIGVVEERVLNFLPTFDMFSPTGEKLAQAKLNFWGTTYTITDSIDNHVIATFYRPFIRLWSDWVLAIEDWDAIEEKNIHPHMFIVLMAFQADRDARSSDTNAWSINSRVDYTVFSEILKNERVMLEKIEPQEEDYLFIEQCEGDDALSLLENHQMTLNQKAVLFQILKQSGCLTDRE